MHKIFLIIFALRYINADDDEVYEKYIDLLPEEEKQEFLNRIARRILEDVNSHDTPNESHADINDEQLNAQNDFVNDIIKEESKTLQTERRDADKENEQQNTMMGDNKDNNDRYIDLTLRTNKKDRRNNSDEPEEQLGLAKELKIIPVKTIYGEDTAVPDDKTIGIRQALVKSFVDNKNLTEFETNEKVNNSKISSENLKVIRKSYDEKLLFRTTISDYDSNSGEIIQVTEDDKVSDPTIKPESQEIVTATENNDDIIFGSTQIIYDSDNDNFESNSSEERMPSTNITTSNDEGTTTMTSKSNFTTETEINEQQTTILPPQTTLNESDIGENATTNKQTYIRSGNIGLQQTTEVKVEKNNTSVSDASEGNSVSKNDTLIITTTELYDAGSHVTEKNNIRTNRSEKVQILESKESKPLRFFTSLETELNDTTVQKIDLNRIKEYEVFEIEAGDTPFVKKSKIQHGGKDVPLYGVPVYNYDPKYAYFMPRTRFAPDTNYETFDSKEKNKQHVAFVRSIFSGYKTRNPFVSKSKKKVNALKNQNENLVHFIRPVNKKILKNTYNDPKDYIDLDYYFDRINSNQARSRKRVVNDGKIFPDTSEELHPYNCFMQCESVKDHIGAVRKILHMNNIFGYVPEAMKREKEPSRKKGKVSKDMSEKLKSDTNNIAVDYYFGVNQNEDAVLAKRSKALNVIKSSVINDSDNGEEIQFHNLIEVLRDFLRFNNEALLTYNWLESTVDILSAIEKLFHLTKQLQFGEDMTSKDLELLKYTIYLYKSSVDTFNTQNDYNDYGNEEKVERKKGMLPKNKWKTRIKEPLKLWKDVAKFIRNTEFKQEGSIKLLYDFDDFLQKIKFYLNDLHDAIKHIAIVTKYDKQKWLEDLKNIYLNDASDKNLLKLLLHLSVSRLFNYIEESTSSGVENNYREYIKNNEDTVEITKKEILFVFNLLDVLKQLK